MASIEADFEEYGMEEEVLQTLQAVHVLHTADI